MANEKETGAEERGSGRSLTWLWMVLSLAVVGGFLFWLGTVSEPSSAVVVEEPTEEDEDRMPLDSGVVAISKDTLAADKTRFEGETIQVSRVEATTQLGPRIFFGELGDRTTQVPILVRLDSTAAEGWEMRQGAYYTITGEVLPMSDSLATAWGEAEEFASDDAELQAAFTDYYIQASRIRTSRGGSSSGSSGGGSAESGTDSASAGG